MKMHTAEQLQALLIGFKKEQVEEIRQRATDGEAEAQFQLGALYANGKGVEKDEAEGLRWLRRAAKQGYPAANTLLGWSLLKGLGVNKDAAMALQHFLSAAESGDADAQCAAADLFMEGGPGIEPSVKAMLAWYQRAAEQNHPKAQFMLGKLLADGQLIQRNEEAAFQWLTLAILNESEPAQKELAMLTSRLSAEELERFKQNMTEAMAARH